MRRWWRSVRIGAAVLAFGLAGSVAFAQRSAPGEGFPLPLDTPRPADSGKPQLSAPPLLSAPPPPCTGAFDCRVRVIGRIERNGAVELNTSLFKW